MEGGDGGAGFLWDIQEIDSMRELFTYIQSDYQRYTSKTGRVINIIKYLLLGHNHCFNYSFWSRLSFRKNILFPLALLMHKRLTTVCIVEDVHIGNNATIGAGAVVLKDMPDGATVAGVPAKVISYKDNSKLVHNRYILT